MIISSENLNTISDAANLGFVISLLNYSKKSYDINKSILNNNYNEEIYKILKEILSELKEINSKIK